MSDSKLSKAGKILLSVVAGAGCAIAVFFICIFLAFATGLPGWADGGDKEYLQRLETTTNLSIIDSVVFALLTAILVIFGMNKSKQKQL